MKLIELILLVSLPLIALLISIVSLILNIKSGEIIWSVVMVLCIVANIVVLLSNLQRIGW
jgi:hypothetical protein